MQTFGGIVFSGDSASQAFLSTPKKLAVFTANGYGLSFAEGERSIEPDALNSRIKVRRGVYFIFFDAAGVSAGAASGTFNFYICLAGVEMTLGADLIISAMLPLVASRCPPEEKAGRPAISSPKQGFKISFRGIMMVPGSDDGDEAFDVTLFGKKTSDSAPDLIFSFAQLVAFQFC